MPVRVENDRLSIRIYKRSQLLEKQHSEYVPAKQSQIILKWDDKIRNLIKYTLPEKCPYSEFFWPVFSRIRTEYGARVSVRIQSECGKIRTRKIPNSNTGTFHAVAFTRVKSQKNLIS